MLGAQVVSLVTPWVGCRRAAQVLVDNYDPPTTLRIFRAFQASNPERKSRVLIR